jgi:hypothetical protein
MRKVGGDGTNMQALEGVGNYPNASGPIGHLERPSLPPEHLNCV